MMGCTCSNCGTDFDGYPKNCPNCKVDRDSLIAHVWGRPSLEEDIWDFDNRQNDCDLED
jgi:hypothetical protein